MAHKENVLISGCLLGLRCRYDGESRPMKREIIEALLEKVNLIPVCPEQLGGLATPRVPAERCGDMVMTKEGKDVTAEYKRGAEEVLKIAKLFGCRYALLKEKSPACSSTEIYNGEFSRELIKGMGVAAELLSENGIKVFGETKTDEIIKG